MLPGRDLLRRAEGELRFGHRSGGGPRPHASCAEVDQSGAPAGREQDLLGPHVEVGETSAVQRGKRAGEGRAHLAEPGVVDGGVGGAGGPGTVRCVGDDERVWSAANDIVQRCSEGWRTSTSARAEAA